MSKTNNEPMQPEAQTGESLKLDVTVRPIAPMGNLLAYANVTIGDCFKIDGFRICSGENGLYVNMPSTQDKQGKWRDCELPKINPLNAGFHPNNYAKFTCPACLQAYSVLFCSSSDVSPEVINARISS